MQLYFSKTSPYARKVRMLSRLTNVSDKIEELLVNVFDNEPMFLAKSPLGKIPCLILDNLDSLYDSQVIGEYIDTQWGTGALHQPLYDSWLMKKRYALSEGLTDAAVALRIEKLKNGTDEFWSMRYRKAIDRALLEISANITDYQQESVCKYSLLSALSYLDFRHDDHPWRERHTVLARFLLEHEQHYSMIETQFG